MRLTARLTAAAATMLVATTYAAASADAYVPAPEAAAKCQELFRSGTLDPRGVTVGDCINIRKGPMTPQARNQRAGICGRTTMREIYGNKGACVSADRP
jgi:hypothetical protein